MIECIVAERNRLPGETKNKFEFLKIDGFRHPLLAPSLLIAKEFKHALNKVPFFTAVAIESFAKLRPELISGVGARLEAHRETKEAFNENGPDFERIRQLAESLKEEVLSACVCALWEQFHGSPEESCKQSSSRRKPQPKPADHRDDPFSNIVALVREKPAGDPIWAEIEHFLQELGDIAAKKARAAGRGKDSL
ncbi:MAG: hypothetical protein H5U02_13570 [Clostridia bacterium]|nr:hypothetical protein [Clostridia bacterium]